MEPAPITQWADPNLSAASGDAKRLRSSATPANPMSRVLDDDNTSSWPAPVPSLDDENLLQEILIRLPLEPSSLPRASLVCTRWRSILSDPDFLKRFRKHHCKPPLLGYITGIRGRNFVPVLDTKPDRIPAKRFILPKSSSPRDYWGIRGCRHGLVILINVCSRKVVVWDPLTGQRHHLPVLRNTKWGNFWVSHAAVLCVDTEDGHVHGDCFSSPFKVVLICGTCTQISACVYESASGVWVNIASMEMAIADMLLSISPSILIGNTVYWLFSGGDILTFDIGRQTLGVIEKPPDARHTGCSSFQLLRTDDASCLGLAVLSELTVQLWKRQSNCDGVVGWVLLQKTIQLEGLFPRGMRSIHKKVVMVGYDEDSNVIVLDTYIGDFMLQLDLMRFKAISKSRNYWGNQIHYPYRNFYTAGRGVGWKWLDLEL